MAGYSAFGSLFRGSGTWVVKDSAAELAASAASWASLGGLSDHLVLPAGDLLYILGGQGIGNPNANGSDLTAPLSAALWRYDTVFETYTALAPMPYPVTRFAASLAGGYLYVVGGIGGDAGSGECWAAPTSPTCAASGVNMATGLDADNANPGRSGALTLIYSLALNAWLPQRPRLTTPRSDSCAVTIGTKLYVVGGYSEAYNITDAVEVLDSAQGAAATWAPLAPIPQPRGDVSCVAVNGLIYVIGGFYDPACATADGCFGGAFGSSGLDLNNQTKFQNSTFSYDPATNVWTRRADMHYHRADHAAATLLNGRIVVAGGEHTRRGLDSKVPQHSVEIYYAADDAWAEKAPMPYARFRFAAASVGQATFAFGGQQLCFASSNNCSLTAANSASVLYELDKPDVFVQLRSGAGAPALTQDDDLLSSEMDS